MGDIYLFAMMAILVLVVVILIIVVLQSKTKQEAIVRETIMYQQQRSMEDMTLLKEKLSQDLLLFQDKMTQSMKGDLHQLNEATYNRLLDIRKSVHEGMFEGFKTTNEAFSQMMQQIARIDQTQKSLQELSGNIMNLQNVLTDKKTRGTFGEIELYSILEMAFGNSAHRYQKQYKLLNGNIVDAVLFAPEPLKCIPIDSKFPLENYNRIFDENNTGIMKKQAENMFRADVLKHIKDIFEKYVGCEETADFAYMFVPAEAVFAYIYGCMDDIIQKSYQYKVYIVSPTTLMAYVTAVKAIYLGQQRNEKVELIQKEYLKLSDDFSRFATRWEAITKDYEKTYQDIQKLNITSAKIQNRFRQIEEVDINDNDDLIE